MWFGRGSRRVVERKATKVLCWPPTVARRRILVIMIRKWLGPVLVFLALIATPVQLVAQDAGIPQKKQEKLLEKKAKEEKKQKAKQEKQDRKRHYAMQDKATRKRMKRHNKRADRGGSGTHKDGFFQRTFGL